MTTFSKVFVAISALTFLCLGFSSYAAKRAFESDPDILSHITDAAQKKGWQIHLGQTGFIHNSYEKTEASWSFKAPQELQLGTVSGNIAVDTTSGDEILVSAVGELDHTTSEQLVKTDFKGNTLVISEPGNGAVKDLKMKILMPASFKGKLRVSSVSGFMKLENVAAAELTMGSVSGDITVKDLSAPSVNVNTVSGGVRVENRLAANMSVKTVSGDILLRIADGSKTNLKHDSISGDVQTVYGLGLKGEYKVNASSTSGDIVVE
jgi:hypothetical protein